MVLSILPYALIGGLNLISLILFVNPPLILNPINFLSSSYNNSPPILKTLRVFTPPPITKE